MTIATHAWLLAGSDHLVRAEIERDFALLSRADPGASIRTWECAGHAVVLGVGQRLDREVCGAECTRLDVPVIRRASGGGAVVVGEGTLQYAIALRYDVDRELESIPGSKRFCHRATVAALEEAGVGATLHADESGDLCVGDRKAAGVALKRTRTAMMLHGTILLDADLDAIASLLRHPQREPGYRAGRPHRDFLVNLGAINVARFTSALQRWARSLSPAIR